MVWRQNQWQNHAPCMQKYSSIYSVSHNNIFKGVNFGRVFIKIQSYSTNSLRAFARHRPISGVFGSFVGFHKVSVDFRKFSHIPGLYHTVPKIYGMLSSQKYTKIVEIPSRALENQCVQSQLIS